MAKQNVFLSLRSHSVWVLERQTPVGVLRPSYTDFTMCLCLIRVYPEGRRKARYLDNQAPNHPTAGGLQARLNSLQSPSQSSGPARWNQQATNTKPSWEQKRSSRNGEAGETSSAEEEATISPAKLLQPGRKHGEGTHPSAIPGGGRAVTPEGSQPHKALTSQCNQAFPATFPGHKQGLLLAEEVSTKQDLHPTNTPRTRV